MQRMKIFDRRSKKSWANKRIIEAISKRDGKWNESKTLIMGFSIEM